MHMEEVWISIKKLSVHHAAGFTAKGLRCQDGQTNQEGTATCKGRGLSRTALPPTRKGQSCCLVQGKWAASTWAKRGLH